jgi:diamine N-acetyltransferase
MRNLPRSVTLRPIDDTNRDAVVALAVAPDQERFVDGVAASVREAAANPRARPWLRAIYDGDTPVGFLMLADGAEPGNGVIPWPYYLWRMLIDARWQGQGYGRSALDLVVAHLRERPAADTLVTSIVPGDGSPYGFYLRYGFQPTGDFFDHETVLALPLARPAAR